MKKEVENIEEVQNEPLSKTNVMPRFYQIDFGNHLRCKVKITDGKIEVEGAINGWGDGVPLEQVVVLELNEA
jgi:hypothetical protein